MNIEINKVHLGDAVELIKNLPDESIDCIITDPPYNTGMKEKKNSTWLNSFFHDDLTDEEYLLLIENICFQLFRVLKNNKAGYIYMNWKKLGLWLEALEDVGFKIKNVIVWDKIIHGLNYKSYAYTHEFIIYFTKGKFYPSQKIKYKGKQYYKDVWNISRNLNQNQQHETVKLIDVVEIPILHSTNVNDIVLDCFGGSGTTAVACKKNNRRFILFEKEQKYVDLTNQRLSQEVLI